jgi:hypothetical protein
MPGEIRLPLSRGLAFSRLKLKIAVMCRDICLYQQGLYISKHPEANLPSNSTMTYRTGFDTYLETFRSDVLMPTHKILFESKEETYESTPKRLKPLISRINAN